MMMYWGGGTMLMLLFMVEGAGDGDGEAGCCGPGVLC